MVTEVRCQKPVRGLRCNRKLATIYSRGPLTVRISDRADEGCVVIHCPRCGSPNQVCGVTPAGSGPLDRSATPVVPSAL